MFYLIFILWTVIASVEAVEVCEGISANVDTALFKERNVVKNSKSDPLVDVKCCYPEFIGKSKIQIFVNDRLKQISQNMIEKFLCDVASRSKEFELVEEFCLDNEMHSHFIPVHVADRLISIFGSTYFYFANAVHGSNRYQGLNFMIKDQSVIELSLESLSSKENDLRTFLVGYCERIIKDLKYGYFDPISGFKNHLDPHDIDTFVITQTDLMIIFQPYTINGLMDGPEYMKIPLNILGTYLNSEYKKLFVLRN